MEGWVGSHSNITLSLRDPTETQLIFPNIIWQVIHPFRFLPLLCWSKCKFDFLISLLFPKTVAGGEKKGPKNIMSEMVQWNFNSIWVTLPIFKIIMNVGIYKFALFHRLRFVKFNIYPNNVRSNSFPEFFTSNGITLYPGEEVSLSLSLTSSTG